MEISPQSPVILVVDDNEINLHLISDLLESEGFNVWVTEDGESAILKVEEQAPDLILLDIMMPGIDGFETCVKLKENPQTKDIPIIFMSALSDTVDKVKGLSLGAVDYLTKPFQSSEVLARIHLHLKLRYLTKKVEEDNQELERRVQQRTVELKSALDHLKQAQSQLQYDAFHDNLTGLPNRAMLMNRLSRVIELAQANEDYLYAVLFLDLDRFKVVNDSLGHLVGDELLKSVASRLQSCLGTLTKIARWGGDEFVVLLPNIEDFADAIAIAQEILETLKKPFKLKNYEVLTGASIGITFSSMGYSHPEEILRDSDIAMYYAKQSGKGRYQVLTREIQERATSRLHLENDLRKGIIAEDFCLYYQPIISLSQGCLAGFEALIRWQHPVRGWVPPNDFIYVAEETGLINPLGAWIWREACRQMSQWQELFSHNLPFAINVNFSPVQLQQENIFREISETFREYKLSPNSLKMEITESAIFDGINGNNNLFSELKKMGIKLCIDDFGTGYSSLSRLHDLPIDTLKIDRSFVNQIESEESSNNVIIKTIIALAHSLKMDIVAEGIENEIQVKKLQALGCEFGQGFFFAKPLNSEAATELIINKQICTRL
jgi:diguanylate cyclase (GGDEF)-like protein